MREALVLSQIKADIVEHLYAGALRAHTEFSAGLEGRDPSLLGRLSPHLDSVQPAFERFGQVNGINPAVTGRRFDAVRGALGFEAAPDALARFPVDFDYKKMRAAVRRADGTWVTGYDHSDALYQLSPKDRAVSPAHAGIDLLRPVPPAV